MSSAAGIATVASKSTKLITVFVYGTLKKGEPNAQLLSNSNDSPVSTDCYAKFIANGQTMDKYPLVIGTRYNIPFLLDRPSVGHNVTGEIYEINEITFGKLDILEDYPNFYSRGILNIETLHDRKIIKCWTYLLKKFPIKLLDKPHLKNYQSTPELPYIESENLDSAYEHLREDLESLR